MYMNKKHIDNEWMVIYKAFPICGDLSSIAEMEDSEVNFAIATLKKLNISETVVKMSYDQVWRSLRNEIVPKFWDHFILFKKKEEDEGEQPLNYCINVLKMALSDLHDAIIKIMPLFKRCEQVCKSSEISVNDKKISECNSLNLLKIHLRATLHSQIPINYDSLIQRVYSAAFKSFCHLRGHLHEEDADLNAENTSTCSGCETETCICENIISDFTIINNHLQELELLEHLAGRIISEMLYTVIQNHVEAICRDSYDQHHISSVEKWLDKVVAGWLRLSYNGSDDEQDLLESNLQKMITANLENIYRPLIYNTYTLTRISQLFNIVIEFPDSQPALEDIRECLEKTDLRWNLVESLRKSIQTRLLHPAVNTFDIIHAYISTVKALRVLDPRGILLELVSEPIRQYLRGRNDFVRYIVTNLTNDSSLELSEELSVAQPLVLDDSYSEVEDMSNWETWTPDPSHAQHSVKSKSQRTADISSILVNIYGSKDIFITEYRTILADRILSQFSYDTEKEICYLERLKVRFGEAIPLLHKCEVMVKDVADSKRINAIIQSDQNPHQLKHQFPVSAMILSSQFWPSFKEESLQLPEKVLQELDIYTKAFQDLKGNRSLSWKHHLGQVRLEIELNSKCLNFTVTPIQATIIYHFEKKSKWTLEELSRVTLIPKTNLRRKLSFWLSQGLIKEPTTDVFHLVEDISNDSQKSSLTSQTVSVAPTDDIFNSSTADDESESVMASTQDQRMEDLQLLWSYIVGMLTNLGSLPLKRIYSMLKMFVEDTGECSLEELKTFLDVKCQQHKLVLTDGHYRLPKP